MKKRLTGATFDASAQTIVHANFSDVGLAGIQLITNVTDNIVIYNFADATKGGSLSTDTLTLDYNTTTMDDADDLMILVEDGSSTEAVSGTVAVTQSGTWDEVGINDSGNSITVDNAQLSVVGSGTEAAAMRVTIATDSTGVLSIDDNGSTLSIDDGGGVITVDGTVAVTNAGITTIAGAVSGTEMQVDVLTMPTTTVQATDLDVRPLVNTDVVTAELSAVDNAVLDTIDAVLDTIKVDTEAIETAVEALQAAQLPDGHNVTVDNPGDIGGGTQYTEGDTDASITGTAMLWEDGSDTLRAVSAAKPLPISDAGGSLTIDGLVAVTTIDSLSEITNPITANLSATDNAVLDAIAASTAAIDTDTTTIIGHLDGVEGLLTTVAGDTTDIEAAVELIDDVVYADDAAFTPATSKVLGIGHIVDDTGTDSVDEGDIGAPRMSADRIPYVQGAVAAGATDSGNPLKVGAKFNSTKPTYTDGQRGDLQIGNKGSLLVTPYSNTNNVEANFGVTNADDVAVSSTNSQQIVVSRNTVFDGSTWDRSPGNSTDGTLVNLGSNNDVSLNAGTNAIGKLLPPDVDVTAHTNYAKKYYTNAGAVTDGIVWSPAAGKRWHIVSLFVNVSAAATVTFEDDKAGGDEAVLKMELAANSGTVIPFPEKYPLASGEDAADLIITTSAGNVYCTVVGYEV